MEPRPFESDCSIGGCVHVAALRAILKDCGIAWDRPLKERAMGAHFHGKYSKNVGVGTGSDLYGIDGVGITWWISDHDTINGLNASFAVATEFLGSSASVLINNEIIKFYDFRSAGYTITVPLADPTSITTIAEAVAKWRSQFNE